MTEEGMMTLAGSISKEWAVNNDKTTSGLRRRGRRLDTGLPDWYSGVKKAATLAGLHR